jgi:hypothetical protein
MENAKSILLHILHLPQFKTLKSHYCYQKFISSLNPRFQKAIAFVYVRQDTLFVALAHHGFKMELNYSKDLFKSILMILAQEDKKCKHIHASRVVFFNSIEHNILKPKREEESVPYYEEMSLGEFTVHSDDEELKSAFEKIRDSIENQS